MDTYQEKDWLNQVAAGSEDAFGKLFRRYRGKLYRYLQTFTQSDEQAEDLVHDIFLKIWSSREKLPGIDNLNAYLFQMARNMAISGFRRKAKEQLILAELRQEHYEPIAGADPASQREIRAFILQAVDKLSDQQKKVFLLSRQEGLRHEQIAEQLGVSINTVKTHIGRALQTLREEISHNYGDLAIAIFVIYRLS